MIEHAGKCCRVMFVLCVLVAFPLSAPAGSLGSKFVFPAGEVVLQGVSEKYVVCAFADGLVRVWETSSGKPISSLRVFSDSEASFVTLGDQISDTGKAVIAFTVRGGDRRVAVVDLLKGTKLFDQSVGLTILASPLAVSEDGELAFFGTINNTVATLSLKTSDVVEWANKDAGGDDIGKPATCVVLAPDHESYVVMRGGVVTSLDSQGRARWRATLPIADQSPKRTSVSRGVGIYGKVRDEIAFISIGSGEVVSSVKLPRSTKLKSDISLFEGAIGYEGDSVFFIGTSGAKVLIEGGRLASDYRLAGGILVELPPVTLSTNFESGVVVARRASSTIRMIDVTSGKTVASIECAGDVGKDSR